MAGFVSITFKLVVFLIFIFLLFGISIDVGVLFDASPKREA
jgi:hypothetical protein